jgi:methylglyoxal reductase
MHFKHHLRYKSPRTSLLYGHTFYIWGNGSTTIQRALSMFCTPHLIVGTWSQASADWGSKPNGAQVTPQQQLETLLHTALEGGVDYLDTAPVYGPLLVEQSIGACAIRHKFKICTKFGVSWPQDAQNAQNGQNGPSAHGTIEQTTNTAYHHSKVRPHLGDIRQQCIDSLLRLQIETIDIFFLHYPPYHDLTQAQAEYVRHTITQLQQEGKIRAFGICNANPHLHPLCFTLGAQYLQTEYNALQTWGETKIFPHIPQTMQIWAYSPLARGLLAGVSDCKLGGYSDHRNHLKLFNTPNLLLVKELQNIAREFSISLSQLAVYFIKQKHPDFCIIAGSRNAAQLQEIIKAWRTPTVPEAVHQMEIVLNAKGR